jgi:hypothetical protein
MAKTLAADLSLFVVQFTGDETVLPQFATAAAGGNKVLIVNTLDVPVTVHHGGALKGTDDFEIPKGGSEKRKVSDGFDQSGKSFRIEVKAGQRGARSRLRLVGDPTIIIL